jgi:hypothetical protein
VKFTRLVLFAFLIEIFRVQRNYLNYSCINIICIIILIQLSLHSQYKVKRNKTFLDLIRSKIQLDLSSIIVLSLILKIFNEFLAVIKPTKEEQNPLEFKTARILFTCCIRKE